MRPLTRWDAIAGNLTHHSFRAQRIQWRESRGVNSVSRCWSPESRLAVEASFNLTREREICFAGQ